LELCSRIKSDINTSHIPVILLTAKGEVEHRIEGLEAGADSYIPKPFHPRHLIVRIEKLLEAMERFRDTFKEYNPHPQPEALNGLSPKDKKLLACLTSFIEDNLENITLNADSLSEHQAMSKTQLYRKIKALTDLTPHGLIKHIRLRKAASLLEKGEKNVSEVFYETGFNNRTYFYRSFKEAYGMTPGEYTRKNKE
jgi:AraC-like DNA-binding protein